MRQVRAGMPILVYPSSVLLVLDSFTPLPRHVCRGVHPCATMCSATTEHPRKGA